jgi:hypothetical protein
LLTVGVEEESMSMQRIVSVLVALGLAACGSRSLNISDGSRPTLDATVDGVKKRDAAPLRKDGCVLPQGYCYESKDCPSGLDCRPGYACKGLAYYQCGCSEIVPCDICSEVIGKCVRHGPCATNVECPAAQYCNVDGHCIVTGAAGGQCAPIQAGGCPPDCPGVCGCDGKTYCSACVAHAVGVSVATSAPCLGSTCAGLDDAHGKAVELQKKCCFNCDMPQCMVKVPSRLLCPCDTYVNGATPAIDALRAEWLARGCPFQSPSVACEECPSPTGAVCDVATSTCVDQR